jgi:hypothetical protein
LRPDICRNWLLPACDVNNDLRIWLRRGDRHPV